MEEQVVSTVVGRVLDLLFGVAIKEIGYMWNCKENVEKFENEVEKLKDMKGRIQQQIDIAKNKGDLLFYGVDKWVDKACDEISKAEAFLEGARNAMKTRFKKGVCGNWGTLHHYGKIMAAKMTPILQLQESGKFFESNGVFIDTPGKHEAYQKKNIDGLVNGVFIDTPGKHEAYQKKNIDGLVTHVAILGDIIKSLENENIQIIGIYGIGGVGKTTLAMEAREVAKVMFDEIAFTTVSKRANANKIQKDTEYARKKIEHGKKVLIILDDVWEKVNLEELCIPCHKNCKILLTSRSEGVCEKMNVQRKIYVNPLPIEEAWILFKRFVGEGVESDALLKPVAEKVAQECGGLPLLIEAVGNALKNEKSFKLWNVALSQLKKHALSEMDPEIEKAFDRLKLSYEHLKSQEFMSCFLLCSMFPEDYNISLEALVYYMVGLNKFNDLDSMEDARGRVQNAVKFLTSSSLLLNVRNYEEVTKMHNVVRHVALLIASQGKNASRSLGEYTSDEGENKYLVKVGKDGNIYLVKAGKGENIYLVKAGKGLTEWLPRDDDKLEDYTGISLMYNKISKLPDYQVHLSSLDIFLVNNNPDLKMISDEFIKGMKEVKVLDLSGCLKTQLPQSLKLLTKLRMLNLEGNDSFHDISLLGEMQELEILILNKTGIKEISEEIGRLVNLRRLEVSRCRYMTRVTSGVISKLEKLEELFIEFSQESEGVYDEVLKLSKLTYLDLMLKDFDHIPEGFISQKLKGLFIQIGGHYRFQPDLKTTSYSTYCLYRIDNLNNIMPDVYYQGININKVENIYLKECPNVSCLVDDSTSCDWDEGETSQKYFKELKTLELESLNKLEVLWKCPDEYISLTNLVSLYIYYCRKLERVFTVRVAQGLVNLKKLDIKGCGDLEEVIWGGYNTSCDWDEWKTKEKLFMQLEHLELGSLDKLEVLWKCPDECISLSNLVTLSIYSCNKLVKVFTVSVAQGLVNLKYLEIENCDGLEEVIWGGDQTKEVVVFPCLAKISLNYLLRLKSFFNSKAGNGNCSIIIRYPSLDYLKMELCRNMEIWGPGIHETPNLKRISVMNSRDHDVQVQDAPNAINEAVEKYRRMWNQTPVATRTPAAGPSSLGAGVRFLATTG